VCGKGSFSATNLRLINEGSEIRARSPVSSGFAFQGRSMPSFRLRILCVVVGWQ
jgi:hypothetical protein